jgi:hypothetical protein
MTEVERIYEELVAVRSLLEQKGSASDLVAFENLAAKTLLLSAASFFERQICASLIRVASETGTKDIFCTFIEKQALERRFHTLFDWNRQNANSFFSLFGPDLKNRLQAAVAADGSLEKSVQDFMFVNSQRNRVVHSNFAAASAEATFDELWQKFNSALEFSNWLPNQLKEAAQAGGEPVAGQAHS